MEARLLPPAPDLTKKQKARLTALYEGNALADAGVDPAEVASAEFDLDLSARYGPLPVRHPFGKASGQLSLQQAQVRADAESGLAFVVLKTVISEDAGGAATMEAWKIREPRMAVERITARRKLDPSAEAEGWTVSWAGRGWEGSLETYLEFMREALKIGAEAEMPVIPSCKFNLPGAEGEAFRREEYEHTLGRLDSVWREVHADRPLVLEKDFSPTLAGDDRAGSKRVILNWLDECPSRIKSVRPDVILGVKLMNALFEEEFQIDMLRAAVRDDVDYLVCFNRMFDPDAEFGEKKGIAFGGPDLSDRNLTALRTAIEEGVLPEGQPVCATGDITSGRMMAEYALRGATSGQLHTFFQLPLENYRLGRELPRSRAALHELIFHPSDGLVAAMCHVRNHWLGGTGTLPFLELADIGRDWFREASR